MSQDPSFLSGHQVMAVFSKGMRDDRVIVLFDWQKVPLGYSAPCSILYTTVNNHETLGSLEAQVKPLFQQAKPTAAN